MLLVTKQASEYSRFAVYLPVATQIPDRFGRIIRKVKSGTTYIYYQYG